MDEAPSSSAPAPTLETGETASADETSDDLPMTVVTGEEDADASDPTAFDDEHLGETIDTSPKASTGAATAPSPETPPPTPPKPESAPTPISGGPEPAGLEEGEQSGPHIKDNRVIVTEQPDWSLVADTFTAFIPECKTIEALLRQTIGTGSDLARHQCAGLRYAPATIWGLAKGSPDQGQDAGRWCLSLLDVSLCYSPVGPCSATDRVQKLMSQGVTATRPDSKIQFRCHADAKTDGECGDFAWLPKPYPG